MKKCNNGHLLQNGKIPQNCVWRCDVCEGGPYPGEANHPKRYSCRQCDYDLCEKCHMYNPLANSATNMEEYVQFLLYAELDPADEYYLPTNSEESYDSLEFDTDASVSEDNSESDIAEDVQDSQESLGDSVEETLEVASGLKVSEEAVCEKTEMTEHQSMAQLDELTEDVVNTLESKEDNGVSMIRPIIPRDNSYDGNSLGIKEIKSEINQILNKTGQGGNIAVGELCPSLPPMAGIFITGYGPVAVPVTAQTVVNLKQHFEQAPYGMGEDTLLDLEVRNSWQLGPTKFQINNEAFDHKIQELVLDVKKRMGCEDVSVESKLYKLLLYEPGGHFKPHRDTEKDDGMFATLIIQLPSVFTGGDLVVTHNVQQEIVKFSQEGSSYSCVFAAHYADCQHELTQVTSGYRLALIYSLCRRGRGSVPSASQLTSSSRLTKFLKLYRGAFSSSPYLVWQLAHLYSKNSLEKYGTEAMKGADRQILDAIMLANSPLDDNDKLELAFLRASKEDEEYGECTEGGYGMYRGSRYKKFRDEGSDNSDESDMEPQDSNCFEFCDVSDYHLGIDSTVPIGDTIVVQDFDLKEILKNVLNNTLSAKDFWGKGKPDECSGPSGNEGATRSMWYHRCFLVMWKKSESAKIRYDNDFRGSIQHIVSLNKNENRDEHQHINRIEQNRIDYYKTRKELDSFLPYCQENKMLILGYQKDDTCVIRLLRVVSSFASPCYLTKTLCLISGSFLTMRLLLDLQKAIEKFSWEILQPEIESIFKNVPDNESGLQNIIKCCNSKDKKPTDLKLSLFKELEKRCLIAKAGVLKKYLIKIWKVVQDYGGAGCNELLQKMVDDLTTSTDLETLIGKMVDAFPDHNHVKNDAFFKGVVDTFLAFAGSTNDETFNMKTLVYLSLSCQDEVSSGLLLTEFKRRIDCGDIGELDCPTILRLHKTVMKYKAVFNDGVEEEILEKVIHQIKVPMTLIKLMDQLQNQDKELFSKQLAKQFLALTGTKRISLTEVILFVKILVKANLEESMKELSVHLLKSPYVEHLDEYLSKILGDPDIKPFPSHLHSLIHKRLSQLEPKVAAGKPPFTWHMPDIFTDRQELTAFLQGPEETFNLTGFPTIIQAKGWVNYKAVDYKKSFTAEARGKGKTSHVFIQKIRNEKTAAVQRYSEVMKEIKKLKSYLPKNDRKLLKPPNKEKLLNSEQLTVNEDIKSNKAVKDVVSEQQTVGEKMNVGKTCPNQHLLKVEPAKTKKIDCVWRCSNCNTEKNKPENLRYICSHQKVCHYNFCYICYNELPVRSIPGSPQQIPAKALPVLPIPAKALPVRSILGIAQPAQQIPGKIHPIPAKALPVRSIPGVLQPLQPSQQIPGTGILNESKTSNKFKFKKIIPCTVTSGSEHFDATDQALVCKKTPFVQSSFENKNRNIGEHTEHSLKGILKQPFSPGTLTSESKKDLLKIKKGDEKSSDTNELNINVSELDTELDPWEEMDDDFLIQSVDSIIPQGKQSGSNESHKNRPETTISKTCLNNHILKLVSSKTRKNDYFWSCSLCTSEENKPETLRYRCSHHKECNFNLCSKCYKARSSSTETVDTARNWFCKSKKMDPQITEKYMENLQDGPQTTSKITEEDIEKAGGRGIGFAGALSTNERKTMSKCTKGKQHRFNACKKCLGCLKGNCGECMYCLDMPRFGGMGVIKQKCETRVCANPVMKTCDACESNPPPKKKAKIQTDAASDLWDDGDDDFLLQVSGFNEDNRGGREDSFKNMQNNDSRSNDVRNNPGPTPGYHDVRRYGGQPSPPAINQEVADYASHMKLQARLAHERASKYKK